MSLLSLLGIDRWIDSWSDRVREAMVEGSSGLEARALLARLEWQEERRRLQRLLVLSLLCIGLAVGVLLGVSFALIVSFWDTPHRIAVTWGIVVFWGVLWLIILMMLIRAARKSGDAFKLTRQELTQDWQALKERL